MLNNLRGFSKHLQTSLRELQPHTLGGKILGSVVVFLVALSLINYGSLLFLDIGFAWPPWIFIEEIRNHIFAPVLLAFVVISVLVTAAIALRILVWH